MRLLLLLTFFSIFFFSSLSAQQQQRDSLLALIQQKETRDTHRVHLLVDYAVLTYHDEASDGKPYIDEALALSKELDFQRGLGFSNTALSGYYYSKGKLDSALMYATKGARILEEINDQEHIMAAYNNMAMIYNNEGKTDLAIETYLRIFEKIENRPAMVQHLAICNNLALAYQKSEQVDEAIRWYEKMLGYAEQTQIPEGFIYANVGLANQYVRKERYELAQQTALAAYDFARRLKAQKPLLESLQILGLSHFHSEDYSSSLRYYREALSIADSIGALRNQQAIQEQITRLYDETGQYEKALRSQQRYGALKDSILSKEQISLMEEMQAKYQTERAEQEKDIAELRAAQSEAEAQEQRQLLWGGAVIFLLILIGLGLFIVQYRSRKRNEFLQLELEASQRQLHEVSARQNAELKAIKAQLNPHFMFNALNSIQEYILLNDKFTASEYLGKFADLMRLYLDQSQTPLITLAEEVRTLDLYIELESLRQEEVQYEIDCPQELLHGGYYIPALLLQPYVENAFKHGLWHRSGEKRLWVKFWLEQELLYCSIRDNGVGRKASAALRKAKHRSFSTDANANRLELIKERFQAEVGVAFIDLENEEQEALGTEVRISLPANLRPA